MIARNSYTHFCLLYNPDFIMNTKQPAIQQAVLCFPDPKWTGYSFWGG